MYTIFGRVGYEMKSLAIALINHKTKAAYKTLWDNFPKMLNLRRGMFDFELASAEALVEAYNDRVVKVNDYLRLS